MKRPRSSPTRTPPAETHFRDRFRVALAAAQSEVIWLTLLIAECQVRLDRLTAQYPVPRPPRPPAADPYHDYPH